MGTVTKFEDLRVWQESRVLAKELFRTIISNNNIEDSRLKDQLNRSSASIMDNVAE